MLFGTVLSDGPTVRAILLIPAFLKRCLWVSAVALGVAWTFYLTPVGHSIDLTLGDQVAKLVAHEQDFSDIVVVDIDEASMAKLASQIGAWPYDRDVFALANDYLLKAGAKVVAFDILFSEARRGDEEFARTLTPQNVLAAASLPYGGAVREAGYRQQLDAVAWVQGSDWPAQAWPDLSLPRTLFLQRSQVGVITMGADTDGIVRRIPLLHRVDGAVLPALTLQVLKTSGLPVELVAAGHRVRVAGTDLPVDEQGMAHIKYPKNWRMRVVPFEEVALAASGSPRHAALAETLRGKIVYVGSSSAILGDFAQTPMGRMAGLYLAAALPSMVKQGYLYQPRAWGFDLVLIGLILAITWAAAHPKIQSGIWLQGSMFPLLIVATIAVTSLAHAYGHRTAVLVPLLTGIFAQLLFMISRQIWLFRRNQRLQIEKMAAEESSRLKGQFLAHMTHELRTPLTAILGFNNINWKSDALGRDDRMSNSRVIDRNGRHLLALINGILDQAKLEAGQVHIVKQPESLRLLVDDIITTMRPLTQEKPLVLNAKIGDETPDIFEIDAFRVRQILLNLVGNALKFTSLGSVTLEVSWAQGQLSFGVTDTGPGLSGEQLSRLFVAFQQANATDAARHGGTGLGLTISKELAHLMGGSIGVESTVGVGTCFKLTIPAQVSLARPLLAPTENPVVPTGPKLMNGTVLIAEDADDLRALAVIFLKRFGLTVLQAKNGREAVDLAVQKAPNVILMDMEMPVLHGLEAVKELRRAGFGRPILAMTAHSGEPHRTLALAAGCNDVLAKPVSQANLRAALESALSVSEKATAEFAVATP